MNIPHNLTPFSRSVLLPAMNDSLSRTASQLSIRDRRFSATDVSRLTDIRMRLAEMTASVWGTSSGDACHLLGILPVQLDARGKSRQGMKAGRQTLQDFSRAYGRLRRWAEWVFDSQWSQAQLLQVMEEIEPMVAEALSWMHLAAIAAVGSYAYLGALISKFEKDDAQAHALRLGLTAGLETPDGQLLAALASGVSPRQIKEQFGHMAMFNLYEIASPRVSEVVGEMIGEQAAPEAIVWDASRAQRRQDDAITAAHSMAGFLGRSELKKIILFAQSALITHAKARDALAYVMAATRHWATAAAAEGGEDGRIQHPDEIFWLEIEEIKQMMTGEWHSRDRIAPLITTRRQRSEASHDDFPETANNRGLGVAGDEVSGALLHLHAPNDFQNPSGFIALTSDWSPAWWRVLLMAEGVIAINGDLLSWLASVSRAGDLSALVGGSAYANWSQSSAIRLSPAQNRAELLD